MFVNLSFLDPFNLGDYRHEKIPIPEPGPLEILVKVEAVGICASDGKVYSGALDHDLVII